MILFVMKRPKFIFIAFIKKDIRSAQIEMATKNKASQQSNNTQPLLHHELDFIKDRYFKIDRKQYLIDTCKFRVIHNNEAGQPKTKNTFKNQSTIQKQSQIDAQHDQMQSQSKQKKQVVRAKTEQSPNCRYNVKSTTHDGYLYTFGGNKANDQQDQVLFAMNLHTQKWQRVSQYESIQPQQQTEPQIFQRDDYGITVHDNQIYIYGGYQSSNDLIKYNPLKEQWSTINTGIASLLNKNPIGSNAQFNQNSKSLINQGPNLLTKKISNSENQNPYAFKNQGRKPRDSQQPLKISNIKPPVRGPGLFFSVNSEFIFLYGGLNSKSQIVYDDAYILKTHSGVFQWEQLKIINPPNPRVGTAYAQCGNRYFMFGGQGVFDDQMCFLRDLYQIIIDQVLLQVEFRPLKSKYSKKQQNYNKNSSNRKQNQCKFHLQPIQRAYHGMVGISKRFFVLFGGQTSQKSPHLHTRNEKQSNILNDMWIFDVFQMRWSSIQPKNGLIKPLHSFAISSYQNKICIFGGLKNKNGDFSQESYIIQFAQKSVEKFIICSNCQRQRIQQQQSNSNSQKNPSMSVSYYYNLANEIRFAFHAISLLIDACKVFEPQSIRISIQKTDNDLQYLGLTFSGQLISQGDFNQFTSNCLKSQKMKTFGNALKYGGFRIGKTILFLSANQKCRRVALLSADSKLVPNIQQSFQLYHYAQDIQTGVLDKYNGRISKQIIRGLLETHQKPSAVQQILCISGASKILIFSTNIITTLEKAFYFELVSYNEPQDVLLYRSGKQVEFLKQVGIPIHLNPQMSLVSFLKYYQLEPSTRLLVNQMQDPIQMISYSKVLKNLRKQNKIAKIPFQIPKNIRSFAYECEFFEVTSQQFIDDIHGVLVYYNNRLINRLDCNFGNLFYEKFYKKNYHSKIQNIWAVVGYLSINVCNINRTKRQPSSAHRLQTNIFCTDLNSSNPEYQKLKREILLLIQQKQYQRQLKKVNKLTQIAEQKEKITKKIKTNQ